MKRSAKKNNKNIKQFLLIFILTLICVASAKIFVDRFDTQTIAPEVTDAASIFSIIKPQDHPRLYFNRTEIENLRRVVLVENSNQAAISAYNRIRNTSACKKPSNLDGLYWPSSYSTALPCTIRNMKATFSYHIEPSTAKAQALKEALLSWTQSYDRYWSIDPQGGGHIHYALPFIYDAIYNAGVLSDSEKAGIDSWFSQAADRLLRSNDYWRSFSKTKVEKEDQIRVGYENWRQWEFHAGVVAGLVSHDDKFTTRILNSFPDNYFEVSNIGRYAPQSRDIKNMINGLVYSSGYNYDGYHRIYGFNAPNAIYNGQNSGQGQHYHFFAVLPAVLGAEAVTQNGYDMWNYGNKALLRTLERSSTWAFSAWDGNLNRDRNWSPIYWIAKKRFPNEPFIQNITRDTRSLASMPYLFDDLLPLWGAVNSSSTNIPPTSLAPTPNSSPANTPSPIVSSLPTPRTSPRVTPEVSPSTRPISTNNLLSNGNFSLGYNNWTFFTNGVGYFLVNSSTETGMISITNPNSNTQLYQKGFLLKPNNQYQLSFKSYSTTGNDLKIYIHKHTTPFSNFGMEGQVVDLTSDWKSFEYTFTTTNLSSSTQDTRIRFWFPNLSESGDRYYFDDVVLSEK
jgi:hypothetical protein